MSANRKKPLQSRAWLAACILISVVITGCGRDMSDLDSYIDQVKSRRSGEIEPLPQMKPYERFAYDAASRRSPFQPDERIRPRNNNSNGVTPDVNRPREPLEDYPLDGLRMMGTLAMNGSRWALVRDSDGIIHRVTEGNHMGRNFGRIMEISADQIELLETIPNGLGGWMERKASIALSD